MLSCAKSQQTCIKNKLDDAIEFTTKGGKFMLANSRVTLKSFMQKADFQSDVKSLKPFRCNDWNDAIKNKGVISETKKSVFRNN